MKVLVTGGAGYIGSHTVVELQQQGHEVFIIDDLSNSTASTIDAIEEITGIKPRFSQFDLCDKAKLASFFQENAGIEACIHFAAKKAVGESVEEPLLYYKNNLISFINLLDEMRENGLMNLVFSSSCTVYGQPDLLPVNEHAKVKPAESPYGNTKQICEEILRDVSEADSIRGIALRYFNPIGAHESALIGEFPIGTPSNLVPFITQTAIGKREKLRVFGNDYNTPDGSCIRDYIHVDDLAKAHILALDRLVSKRNKSSFEVFNLGTGKGNSVLEVVRTFEQVNQVEVNKEIVERRVGDVEQVWADTTLANQELGWKAVKGLEEMLNSAWKWEQSLNKVNE